MKDIKDVVHSLEKYHLMEVDVPKPQPGIVEACIKNDWDWNIVNYEKLLDNSQAILDRHEQLTKADEPLVISKCQTCGTILRSTAEFCDNPNCEFAVPI